MSQCKNCGNELRDGVQFCGKCGCKVLGIQNHTAGRQAVAGKPRKQEKGSKKLIAIIIVCCVAVAAVVFILSMAENNRGISNSNVNNIGLAAEDGGNVYFTNYERHDLRSFVYNKSSGAINVLNQSDLMFMNLYKDHLYCIQPETGAILKSSKVNGVFSSFEAIYQSINQSQDSQLVQLIVYKDNMYWMECLNAQYYLYKSDLNGENIVLLDKVNEPSYVIGMNIENDIIYYGVCVTENQGNSYDIYAIGTDGNSKQNLLSSNTSIWSLIVHRSKLYFFEEAASGKSVLVSYDIKTQQKSEIISGTNFLSNVAINGGRIFYCKNVNANTSDPIHFQLLSVDLNGNNPQVILDQDTQPSINSNYLQIVTFGSKILLFGGQIDQAESSTYILDRDGSNFKDLSLIAG